MARLTVLVENAVQCPHLLAEHGTAYWIETGGHRVLFDTGQGEVLRHNAKALGISLDQAHAVVLSHGHYDHACGLRELHTRAAPRLFAHAAAFRNRYSMDRKGSARSVGMLWPEDEKQRWENSDTLVTTSEPTEVCDGLWATGRIPRTTDFEDSGGRFYLDADGTVEDGFEDDQALFLRTDHGTVILLGCAHAGVINTVRYVQTLTEGAPLRAVLGGMHLLHASADRLERTRKAFTEFNGLRTLAPNHCTGEQATDLLHRSFPRQWANCHAGAVFEF